MLSRSRGIENLWGLMVAKVYEGGQQYSAISEVKNTIRDPNICQKTYTIYHLICLKCHNFYAGMTTRTLHIRIKEHLNTRASSFHKHLVKCKNNIILSIRIEAIVHNVSNLRIKEALLIANLYPQINSRLELNTEYIINMHISNTYLSLKIK